MIDHSLSYAQLHILCGEDVQRDEYVIFGSAALYLRGIREAESVGDLDLFVSKRLWGRALERHVNAQVGATVETPRVGDPPFICYPLDTPIHLFYAWTERDREWISAEECFAQCERVASWNAITVQLVRQHKLQGYVRNLGSPEHEKHQRDLKLIDEYLWRQGRVPPHLYQPAWEAMGDCEKCGHVAESPVHDRSQIGY